MSEQLDMFRYPVKAGSKRPGTSERAARSMDSRVPTLRSRIMALFDDGQQLSADECAFILGETPFGCRPRLTELLRLGLIEETGMVRRNISGRMAMIFRKAKPT